MRLPRFVQWFLREQGASIIHTSYQYIFAQDKFSACKAEEGGDAVASLTDDNEADGNLDK